MLNFDTVCPPRHEEVMADDRKPRFKRVTPTTKLQLVESQYQVLELLHQFKAMRTQHLLMHLPSRSYVSLRRSLRNLFDHGLIDKVADLRRFNALYQHDVYTLTDKGRDALAGRDLPPQFVPTDGELGFRLNHEWDHSMMIIDLLSNLKVGAMVRGIQLISAEEIAERAIAKQPFILPRKTADFSKKYNKRTARTVVPDGMVGLRYPDGRTAYFAIEAEHNKPNMRADDDDPKSTASSTRKTFRQYVDLDFAQVYKNLGISNLRVLVVAPTPTQISNKFAVGRKDLKQSNLFLGHWLPVVSGLDVPTIPEIIDAPWLRVGLEEERINACTLRTRAQSA